MILGIDTSNYTTSAAVLDGEALTQQKQLLEVRPGERGLRQSDALFQHTRNLPLLFDKLPPMDGVTAVGVSTRPRNVEGSYMPCFLAGISAATAAAKAAGCPLYTTSHQVGTVDGPGVDLYYPHRRHPGRCVLVLYYEEGRSAGGGEYRQR